MYSNPSCQAGEERHRNHIKLVKETIFTRLENSTNHFHSCVKSKTQHFVTQQLLIYLFIPQKSANISKENEKNTHCELFDKYWEK